MATRESGGVWGPGGTKPGRREAGGGGRGGKTSADCRVLYKEGLGMGGFVMKPVSFSPVETLDGFMGIGHPAEDGLHLRGHSCPCLCNPSGQGLVSSEAALPCALSQLSHTGLWH